MRWKTSSCGASHIESFFISFTNQFFQALEKSLATKKATSQAKPIVLFPLYDDWSFINHMELEGMWSAA